MGKIDVSRAVAEMERALRSAPAAESGVAALAALERWQWDEMLDDASRARARRLVCEFRRTRS
ncbi:MAG: hypothetical protein ACRERC_13505 [Candidatus Binatia bacterium]